MKLIFTSYSGVYVLDTETRDLRPIHTGRGMYYGITWLDHKLYVAARNSISDYRLGNEKILVFDKELKQTGELGSLRDCGLHSILMLPNHQLWITCSLKNKIARYDILDKKFLKDYYPSPEHKDTDVHHFNALTWDAGRILINVHNQGRKNSEIWECDPDYLQITLKINIPGASHSHCCWRERNKFWTCASEESQILNNEQEALLPQKLDGYTRGIVLTQNRLILGESQRAVREDRATAGGLIHIYERGTMRHITTYQWPKIGQIAEIRALDAIDELHWPEPFWETK